MRLLPTISLFSMVYADKRNYLAVSVAAVAVVATVGLMKKTSLTFMSLAVGFAVPDFTVMLPFPRFGAVSKLSVLLTFAANLNVQTGVPEVLHNV